MIKFYLVYYALGTLFEFSGKIKYSGKFNSDEFDGEGKN